MYTHREVFNKHSHRRFDGDSGVASCLRTAWRSSSVTDVAGDQDVRSVRYELEKHVVMQKTIKGEEDK